MATLFKKAIYKALEAHRVDILVANNGTPNAPAPKGRCLHRRFYAGSGATSTLGALDRFDDLFTPAHLRANSSLCS